MCTRRAMPCYAVLCRRPCASCCSGDAEDTPVWSELRTETRPAWWQRGDHQHHRARGRTSPSQHVATGVPHSNSRPEHAQHTQRAAHASQAAAEGRTRSHFQWRSLSVARAQSLRPMRKAPCTQPRGLTVRRNTNVLSVSGGKNVFTSLTVPCCQETTLSAAVMMDVAVTTGCWASASCAKMPALQCSGKPSATSAPSWRGRCHHSAGSHTLCEAWQR